MSARLEVEGLTRVFRVRESRRLFAPAALLRAVNDVSLTVEPGEMLGIVGESGCGKSTLARLVLGLLEPSAGAVRFGGMPVTAKPDAAWRRMRSRMQMVYQDPMSALDRRLTALRQVEEPIAIHEPGTNPAARRRHACEALERVGLPLALAERFPHELSGGQRQRVVIARALVMRPDLLVCDEPVSALDVSVQAQILALFAELRCETGFTSIFISHDLKVVRQIADRVAVMYLGRIVETGTPEAVFHAPAHPYTRALVSAIPDPRRRMQRILLKGEPPNPAQAPGGCPFHPRCPRAAALCAQTAPALLPERGRAVACHFPEPAAEEAAA